MRQLLLVCGVIFLLPLCLQDSAAQPGGGQKRKISIEGYVYNSSGNPIGGIDVTVWVAGKDDKVKGTRTDPKTGKYILKDVEVTSSFDIAYTHSKYLYSVVEHLAEKKDQKISKVLYAEGEKMPATAVHSFAHSLDRVAFLTYSLPKNQRKEFLKNFGGSVAVPTKEVINMMVHESSVPVDARGILLDALNRPASALRKIQDK